MNQVYKPGDVYFCTFPKFQQIPNARDYNIDSLKPSATPRPIVILQQVGTNRVIAAPITGDDAQFHKRSPTFVPLRRENYSTFLKKDSFVKTDQLQILDMKWMYPSNAPRKVGQIQGVELDRVFLFSMYATQTELAYARWISEIVAKSTRLVSAEVERDVMEKMGFPPRPAGNPGPVPYSRGDIYMCHFQPILHPQTKERLEGTHPAIILTDSTFRHIPPGRTIVVPLLENSAEHSRFASQHDVILPLFGKTYRALVSQIQPMNSDWMDKPLHKLNISAQLEVDRAILTGLGMREKVIEQAKSIIKTRLHDPKRGR